MNIYIFVGVGCCRKLLIYLCKSGFSKTGVRKLPAAVCISLVNSDILRGNFGFRIERRSRDVLFLGGIVERCILVLCLWHRTGHYFLGHFS